jgi:hypothetical protein
MRTPWWTETDMSPGQLQAQPLQAAGGSLWNLLLREQNPLSSESFSHSPRLWDMVPRSWDT